MSRIGKHYSHLVVWQGRLLGLLAGVCQQGVLTTAYLLSLKVHSGSFFLESELGQKSKIWFVTCTCLLKVVSSEANLGVKGLI